MSVWIAFLYGVIQGLTEFFPVSSSAHLALLPAFFSFKDPGVFFDLSMHLGTALAVTLVFFQDLKKYIRAICLSLYQKKMVEHAPYAWNLVLATLVSIVAVLILRPYYDQVRDHKNWIAINLIVFGLLLFLSDFLPLKKIQFKHLQIVQVMMIGLAQAFAIFPGVSRSGITITMSRSFGHDLISSSKFSFLLSLPLILGGFILKLKEIQNLDSIDITAITTGFLVSFIVGVIAIKSFLVLINRKALVVYLLYRICLALAIIISLS